MRRNKHIATASIVLAIIVLAIPTMTQRANAAGVAIPCGFFGSTPVQTATKCAILILSPGSGGILNNQANVGPSFLVSFLVRNFTLVQPGTINDVNTTTATGPQQPPQHNQGHIHVFVDNKYITIWTTTNGIPLTLPSGAHTIKLELVNDFHQSFSPPVTSNTNVTVANAADTIQSAVNSDQTYSLAALAVSVITLILVAYVAFRPKTKTPQ